MPENFNDLAKASVYCTALGLESERLRPAYKDFDITANGTIRYYRITADGSYVRAQNGAGDFLRAVTADGREVFLHYSQAFQPTQAEQQKIGITMQVLSVAYQNANQQMAILSEFIREAEVLNSIIERFQSVFNSLSNLYAGCNPANPHMVLPFEQKQLTALEDLKMPSAVGTFATHGLPQLYARVIEPDLWWNGHKWEFFFIDVDSDGNPFENVVHETKVCYGRFGSPNDPPDYKLESYTSSVERMEKSFGSDAQNSPDAESYAFKTWYQKRWWSDAFTRAIYFRCTFKSDGKVVYEPFCGGRADVDITEVYKIFAHGVSEHQKAVGRDFFGVIQKKFEEIIKDDKRCYITGAKIQEILDAVRLSIDCNSSLLQETIIRVGAVNNDMEQCFSVATSTIEATGEGRRRTLANTK